MKADMTRSTFGPHKHYKNVRMQQGRVQLDADWNEQSDIAAHHEETEILDIVGRCGAPMDNAGFAIGIQSNNLSIGAGRYYVDGILCENEAALLITAQPDLPFTMLPVNSGIYFAYLDVWSRHITALEDTEIREVALGGPDTATRLKTVWQVKLIKVGEIGENINCLTTDSDWSATILAPDGKLAARAKPNATSSDPCIIPPGAGYRRLENQLYRVEVHTGGALGTATFKWSRDNGSIVAKWASQDGNNLTVMSSGRDKVLSFASGQWVELTDDTHELQGLAGTLVKLMKVEGQLLTIDPATATGTTTLADFPINPKIRRWDSEGLLTPTNLDWIDVEDGVQVRVTAGSYKTGDYWLIPARTATTNVEWPQDNMTSPPTPLSLFPKGIQHHFCRLAVVAYNGTVWSVPEDCRTLFPPLTHICAKDVCFDPSHCIEEDLQWGTINTVQAAIEALCHVASGADLREHNKYLHGSGVVCGLQVTCAEDRSTVVVEEGYALDCEGYSIRLKDEDVVNIVALAKKQNLLDDNTLGNINVGTGNVCLAIHRGAQGEIVYTVEKEAQQSFWESVLEGTLLKDFYEECLAAPYLFLKLKFLPFPATEVPVPTNHKRTVSVINLLWQLINPTTGRYVFLSHEEHTLLLEIYNTLKAMLHSESFCAMFDNVQPFPNYPYALPSGIETAFGLFQFHTRMRLHPSGQYAYTCGIGNRIHVFDLSTHQMVHAVVFPGGSNLDVSDVAFSEDGTKMYAVGILTNSNDSIFATANIVTSNGTIQTHAWGPTTIVCDIKFVTLMTSSVHSGKLYAIGKSQGLYVFDPTAIPPVPFANVAFNATGLLTLSTDGDIAYAAENHSTAIGIEAATFTRVRSINLSNFSVAPMFFPVLGNNQDNDLAFSDNSLYVTGDPLPRTLHRFNATTGAETVLPVNLVHSTLTRLAVLPNSPYLLISQMDQNRIVRVDLAKHTLDATFRIPVQIMPIAIKANKEGSALYASNFISNTVSVINMQTVLSTASSPTYTMEPPLSLNTYRDAILQAYGDILGKFLQYLKDCFCEKFLIDCPACEETDKVYLGCVTIHQGKVYKICNFTKRRYVKSVRTVEYWLSVVPIIPVIKQAFSKFCCKVF